MTKKEVEYLNRLHARRRILEARLAKSSPEFAAYVPMKKELNALKWAIEKLEGDKEP